MSGAIPPEVLGVGLLIIGGMLFGMLAMLLRQPLILAYIGVGALISLPALGIVTPETQAVLSGLSSDLGIAFLLFVVGLELSFKKILEVKNVVTFGTIATSVVLFIVGLFGGYFLGRTFMEGVYIGLVLAFSSTLLVVKALGEKNQTDTLPGRIMIGTLVFQDIIAILAISVLAMVAGAEPTGFVRWVVNLPVLSLVPGIKNIAVMFGAILLLLFAYLLNRYVARYLFAYIGKNIELLFIGALGFFFTLSFLAAEVGFSISIGAFLSGMIIANTDYYLEILSKIKTLAVFFSVLFFATLGFQLTFDNFTTLIIPLLVICVLTLIVKPLVTAFIVRMFGYDMRTSLLTGLHMSQVSEFVLILVAVGIANHQVQPDLLTITVLALLITMTVSTYFMKYSAGIVAFLQKQFPRLGRDDDTPPPEALQHADVVVYGFEHIDEQLLEKVRKAHENVLVVDPDPVNIEYLRHHNVMSILGSLSNEEIMEKLRPDRLKVVLSTVSDLEENLLILDHLRKHKSKCVIVMPARKVKEALMLYEHGATYVLVTSFVDDTSVQGLLFNPDAANVEKLKRNHVERLTGISLRHHGALDIEDFLANLADQHFKAGKKVFDKTNQAMVTEVDKLMKNMGGKKK